ncbi:MAG TPA: winged helix-turn-helix domain-containing protein [Gemmatimonadales bacterium]|jgi:DNA-binding transcriptional ArsR family regulator|nr:winged helix-turn-helix domain-containing protein [Gemmatimonadales bacterium]
MPAPHVAEESSARIAAAIGDPARARMLYALMEGRALTSTELALVAAVGPSTASAHLNRLKRERLVRVLIQGRHRYYSLYGTGVAGVLESLSVLAGRVGSGLQTRTPDHLRLARTCYDHIAGTLGVLLHDRLLAAEWISGGAASYEVTAKGTRALAALGIDVEETRRARRRFAFPCLDWSERRCHLGGAVGAALLESLLKRRWVTRERRERTLSVTTVGARELRARFGVVLGSSPMARLLASS